MRSICIRKNNVCGNGQQWRTSCVPSAMSKVVKSALLGSTAHHTLSMGCAQWLPSREDSMGGEKESNFPVGKLDKLLVSVGEGQHHGAKSCWQYIPLLQCDDNDTLPLSSSSLKHITQAKKNTRPIPVEGHPTKEQSSKLSRSQKTRRIGETVTAKKSLKGHDN